MYLSRQTCSSISPSSSPSPPIIKNHLKFGMDRILSNDNHIQNRRLSYGASSPVRVRSPSENSSYDGHCVDGVPCSECVSSLMRCCTVSSPTIAAPTPTYAFYPSLHHLPPPPPPPSHHHFSIFPTESLGPHHLLHAQVTNNKSGNSTSNSSSTTTSTPGGNNNNNKRKRSWSRAVFSNLQRKGLEKRFQLQKYITKPDRRQLAATLGLTDAQVKVWFQNRRMKWRHSKEGKSSATSLPQQSTTGVGNTIIHHHMHLTDNEHRAADSTQRGDEATSPSTSDESDIEIE